MCSVFYKEKICTGCEKNLKKTLTCRKIKSWIFFTWTDALVIFLKLKNAFLVHKHFTLFYHVCIYWELNCFLVPRYFCMYLLTTLNIFHVNWCTCWFLSLKNAFLVLEYFALIMSIYSMHLRHEYILKTLLTTFLLCFTMLCIYWVLILAYHVKNSLKM